MSAKAIMEAAFTAALEEAGHLSAEYQQRLDDFRVHALAVVDAVEAGRATPEQAMQAAEQEKTAIALTLLSGAYDAQKAAAGATLNVVLAVVKAALVAV